MNLSAASEPMFRTRFLFALIPLLYVAGRACSVECGSTPAKEVNLDQWSTRSLLSPDQRWKFLSVGPHSTEKKAPLYIQNTETSKKWLIGRIERNGTERYFGVEIARAYFCAMSTPLTIRRFGFLI
jgi:hypothetical protein